MRICEIRMKLPSCNDYIDACRANRYAGAEMKKRTEADIAVFIRDLPKFEQPVAITFVWQEKNNRRDYDNVAFAKKFILDALVKCGKLKDDNRKHVRRFADEFTTGPEYKVTLEIKELK